MASNANPSRSIGGSPLGNAGMSVTAAAAQIHHLRPPPDAPSSGSPFHGQFHPYQFQPNPSASPSLSSAKWPPQKPPARTLLPPPPPPSAPQSSPPPPAARSANSLKNSSPTASPPSFLNPLATLSFSSSSPASTPPSLARKSTSRSQSKPPQPSSGPSASTSSTPSPTSPSPAAPSPTPDLEPMVAGEASRNAERERRSDFYNQPWVEDAVIRYLNRKPAGVMMAL